ncbi:MAG TPA: polysaccharide deacetylase family protein [Candidatus Acidoferrum sp.]|nr:polysaccharide deacetylase family protein [Candidatus Acidoferrum sp.]
MKLQLRWLSLAVLVALFPATNNAQTLAEKLGYPKDAKLLIIHADDVAETHAVNAATFQAVESGAVNSASIMVPCPWFPEAADYARSHPEVDFGLHLTLTSERVYYRWGPVAARNSVPSLVDSNGYFHHDWDQHPRIDPRDVETELRAQIERARAMGVRPSHFDSHQYRLIENGKEIFQVFVRLGHEYGVPIFVARDWFSEHPYLEASLGPRDLILDHTVTISPDVPAEKWADFYRDAVKNLQPGVTEFVIHVGLADEELRAATRERATWGAAWRQRDFDFFMSKEFRSLLEQQRVKLITWRELATAAASR